jgi:hypothetical protein
MQKCEKPEKCFLEFSIIRFQQNLQQAGNQEKSFVSNFETDFDIFVLKTKLVEIRA